MRIRWLKRALQSLDAAMAHIAREDEEAAKRISEYSHARIESLQELPHQGRPGRIFGTRELVMETCPFIVPYRVSGEEVQILRVFHTSRKPPQMW